MNLRLKILDFYVNLPITRRLISCNDFLCKNERYYKKRRQQHKLTHKFSKFTAQPFNFKPRKEKRNSIDLR